jgi:cellobiose phosphorylase
MNCINGIIDHGTNVNIPPNPQNFQFKDQSRHTFMAIAGAHIHGFDTDREIFIGHGNSYCAPGSVVNGRCKNSIARGDNGCGALQVKFTLKPKQRACFAVIMGIGKADNEGLLARKMFSNTNLVKQELSKLKQYWHSQTDAMKCSTPSRLFNSMFNTWNPYNNLLTFTWSRAASLVYNGERDGLGYRDTLQDMTGIVHCIPDMVKERLSLMITGQASTGGAMSVVKPFAHFPGKEKTPSAYRCDDSLWLFNAVPAYVKETGNIDFFSTVLPYCDNGNATVFEHLKQAILFSMERSGKRGLPCGLEADWNDCVRLGADGESVFAAFQLRLALAEYIEICDILDKKKEKQWAQTVLRRLDANIETHAWDGKWYARAFRADGLKFGASQCAEGKIFLNPQTWAVISGHTGLKHGIKVMNEVKKQLATIYGIELCTPPFTIKTDWQIMLASLVNPGMKENGGIFNHTQGWAVMAEAMLGRGQQAWEYYKAYMPAAYNNKADLRETEPYVYSQSTHGRHSPRFGASRVPWLSGAAAWAYYSAAQYILGIRPGYTNLIIDPAIPAEWKSLSVKRKFRGMELDIKISNPQHKQHGVKSLVLNGKKITGCAIPVDKLEPFNIIKVRM